MNQEIISDIRNKLTAPKVALEKLSNGEALSREFLILASKELNEALDLLRDQQVEPR